MPRRPAAAVHRLLLLLSLVGGARALAATAPRSGVLVVGSANVDLVAYAPRLPVAGETLAGLSFEQLPGGKGANQAVAAAKLGSATRLVTQVGADGLGAESRANYEAAGIDVAHVFTTSEAKTGVALITVGADSGNNAIVVVPGAGGLLSPAHVDEAAAAGAFAESGVLLTQLEVPLETTLAALRRGREAGCVTICNTAPAPADGLPEELLRLTDVLCPNESEAAALSGLPTRTDAECEAAARALLRQGAGAVVMTLGERGCLRVTPDGGARRVAVPAAAMVGPVRDTIGAGDAFLGALAHRLAAGAALDDALPAALYAASISVQRRGAQASYATEEELPPELRA